MAFLGEAFDLTVTYTKITIFYVLFIIIASMCNAILNSYSRYALAAAMPAMLNVLFITGFGLVYLFDIQNIGIFMCWVALLGGLAQLIPVYIAVWREGIKLLPTREGKDGETRQLMRTILPAMFSNSVVQINLIVGSIVASFTVGAVSWLQFADRIYQLPLGVVATAVGVVLLPELSARFNENDAKGAKTYFNQAFSFTMILIIPASFSIFVLALPIIRTIFEGGEFDYADSISTANALAIYAIGLPAFAAQKVIQPLFYANKDTKTPAYHALFNVILHAVVAFGLLDVIGYLAAPVASALSAYTMCIGLWWSARKYSDVVKLEAQTIKQFIMSILVAAVMAIGAYLVCQWNVEIFDTALAKWVFLAAVVGVAIAFYFTVMMVLIGLRPSEIMKMARRS